MKKKLMFNSIISIFSQIIIIILGIIIPRIFIASYGSDVNGLLGTIGQIYTYVALLESGICAATQNALYEPIAKNDNDNISEILSISNSYYHRVTILYSLAILALAFIVPLLLKTNVDYWTVFVIFILEGLASSLNFWFIEKWRALLAADGKQYVESLINCIVKILTYSIKLLLSFLGWSIIFLSFFALLISFLRLVIYYVYTKKVYPWVKIQYLENKKKLEDRNAYVISDIAWTIFSSTDMFLLSAVFSTALASVYSVYNMIYSNLASLMNVFYSSVSYILGQVFFADKERYVRFHDGYETVFIMLMSIAMSSCAVLTIPFVQLYIKGVADINYVYKYLPFMMGEVQLLSWDRYVSGNLVCIAGYAKQSMKYSLIEAALNVVLSLILSLKFGIYGVVFATICSLLYKLTMLTILANQVILKRKCIYTIRRIFINNIIYILICIYFIFHPIQVNDMFSFFLTAFLSLFCMSLIFMVINVAIERKTVKFIFNIVLGRK